MNNVVQLPVEQEGQSELEVQFQLVNTRLDLLDVRMTRLERLALEIKQIVSNGRTYEQD